MPEMNQEFLQKLLSGKYNPEQEEQETKQSEVEPSPASFVPNPERDVELKELPIDLLADYPNQPLPPYTEEEMTALLDSIRSNGIITPLLVRPYGEGFQIIDGRNRCNGSRKAGYNTVPCIVRNLSDDEAAIYLVESIFRQRDMSKVSIMQKSNAYRLWMDAMKRQGRRNDLTSEQIAPKLSSEIIADQQGISKDQVKRLIRLTYLISELQDKVDENKSSFPILAAVQVSFLTIENQDAVHRYFFADHNYGLSIKTAERLRAEDSSGEVFSQSYLNKLWGEISEFNATTGKVKKLVLPTKKLKRYYSAGHFKADTTEQEMEDIVFKALDYYFLNPQNT